jgi:hypothetical protein
MSLDPPAPSHRAARVDPALRKMLIILKNHLGEDSGGPDRHQLSLKIQLCSPSPALMGQLPKIARGISYWHHAFFLHFFIDKRFPAI